MLVPSMVVDDLDVPRAVVSPSEANSPLIIDSDAVPPTPITGKLLQSVAGRHSQVVQIFRAVQHLQLSLGLCLERTELPRRTASEDLLGVARSKRPNHLPSIV